MPDRRRAWARALFLAAPDRGSRAAFAEALEVLSSAAAGDGRLRELLSDPAVAREAKASLLASALPAIAGAAQAGAAGRAVFERFCHLIVDKSRSLLIPEIARSYGELRDADEGIARLEVEAAREVPAQTLESIAAAWTASSGSVSTRARVKINPALIAGYRLRAGSLRIDYSIAGRLERLRRQLAQPLAKSQGKIGTPGGSARGEG